MKKATTHDEQQVFLKRIEGQVRGIQRMIKEKRYCIDILTQLHSVVGAILRVEDKILQKHLHGCVAQALNRKSALEKQTKIDEIINLINKFRRT